MAYRKCATIYTAKQRLSTGEWLPEKQCGRRAVKGQIHCKTHMGNTTESTLPKPPHVIEALHKGLARYHAALKAVGLKHNQHLKNKPRAPRRQKEVPGTPPVRQIMQTVKILDTAKAQLPAVPDKPFEQLEDHEKLTSLTGITLDLAAEIISKPRDPDNTPLLFKAQMKLISDVWSFRYKTDKNSLAVRKQDRLVELVERLKGEAAVDVTPQKKNAPD